ncbi:hypothetical protein COB72_11135 [bacterium]|nr:MAG: hypothetical protein COB72_11135 [bacterium]
MNKLNTKSRTQTRKKIEPSTRDSISTWLDVLTAMLVMPDTQRLQVRDELEDHLRSRVDDLLIMGKSEPQAIRIAVAELGETAELAKLITHAHTKSNPRRKIMNAALITVALAGMSFGGYSFINGTGAPSATPSNGGAVPVVMPSENNREDGTYSFDIQDLKLVPTLAEVAEAFDLSLSVGDGVKENFQQANMYFEKFTVQGEMTLAESIKKIQRSSEAALLDYVIKYDESKISVFTQDEAVRRTVTTRVYPIPVWLYTAKEKADYPISLMRLLEVKYDLGCYTSIQLVSSSIVVAAPPEIHDEIADYEVDLENVLREQGERSMEKSRQREDERKYRDEDRERERQVREEQRRKDREHAIERIQKEFESVRSDLLDIKAKSNSIASELKNLQIKSIEASSQRAFNPEIPIDEELQAQIARRTNTLDLLEFELDETQERYIFLRSRLIQSEYANLFKGLE